MYINEQLAEEERLLNDLARFITSSHKVKVFHKEGSLGCCNVETGIIWLGKELNYFTRKAVNIHECAHFLFTRGMKESDFKGITNKESFKDLVNSVEDMRCEHKINKIIPEAKRLITSMERGRLLNYLKGGEKKRYINGSGVYLFFARIKSEEQHLKDILIYEPKLINKSEVPKIEAAFQLWKENETSLLNGCFNNVVLFCKQVYNILGIEEEQPPQEEEPKKGKSGGDQPSDKEGDQPSDKEGDQPSEEKPRIDGEEIKDLISEGRALKEEDFRKERDFKETDKDTSEGGKIEVRDINGSDFIKGSEAILTDILRHSQIKSIDNSIFQERF